MTTPPKVWKEKIPFIILMIGGIVFYGITIFSNLESFKPNRDYYKSLGVNLRVHGVYGFGDRPTAYRPPLYPMLLAATSYVTGLLPESAVMKGLEDRLPNQAPAGLNFLLAVLTVALVYRIGRRMGLPTWIAAIAGLLVLIDPAISSVVKDPITEPIATFFMVLVIDQLLALDQTLRYRPLRIFGTGLLIGLASLCRPNFLVYGLLCLPFIVLLEWFKVRSFRALVPGILILAGIACFIIPWGIRNQLQLGRFIPTTTHGGITLFMVNCDPYYNDTRIFRRPLYTDECNDVAMQIYQRLQIPVDPNLQPPPRIMWQMPSIITRPEQEWIIDDAYYAEAKRTIAARKVDCLKGIIERIVWIWFPSNSGYFSVDFILKTVELLMVIYVFLLLVRKFFCAFKGQLSEYVTLAAGCWLFISILSIQIPSLFYNYEGRMRPPILPTFALLGVFGLYSLIETCRNKWGENLKKSSAVKNN